MGTADVIPGISGGTVALLMGIYDRLLTAITKFNGTFFRLLFKREFKKAWNHADLTFICTLVGGLGTGFAVTLVTVKGLLENETTRPPTLSVFLGLIFASAFLLLKTIRVKGTGDSVLHLILGILGTALAAWIALMTPQYTSEAPHLGYVFLCGVIGICAMILPGISGAMLLCILGTYEYFANIPKEILKGHDVSHNILVVIIFVCGCVVGLTTFCRFLKWLLRVQPARTMSFLVGLMFGSLVRLWPFQILHKIEGHKGDRVELVLPSTLDSQVAICVLVAVAACITVIVIDRLARTKVPQLADGPADSNS